MRTQSPGTGRFFLATFFFFVAGIPFSLIADESTPAVSGQSLKEKILALDQEFFAAFNNCDIESWRPFLADDIEFYQDNDDVTTSRLALEPSFLDRCDSTGRAAVQRELVADSVEIHPIQGYGAVQFGAHRFWIVSADGQRQLGSTPRFVHLWRNKDGAWQITRVISYGH